METSKKFNWILIIIYFLITLTALFFHEIWRDEAQAWCIVRDLGFIDIYNMARVEGHPMLWYLILFPFAKTGLPIISMQFVSWLIVFASVIFFVFKSPFNCLQKTLITFSAGIIYFLPIIARNYALIPIFIFLLAYFYPKRTEKPYLYSILIILLSQTHILMLGFSLNLAFIFFFETRKKLIPAILFIINFSFIFYSFYNMSELNLAVNTYNQHFKNFYHIIKYFSDYFFTDLFNYTPAFNLIIFYGTLAVILYSLFKTDKKIFTIFSVSLIYIFFVYLKIWFGGIYYQKAFLLLLIFVFCFWCIKNTYKTDFKLLNISLIVLFSISSIIGCFNIFKEIKYDFSGSKKTAEFIKNNLKNEKNFIVYGYLFTFSPISGYLKDYNLYSNMFKGNITYYNFVKNSYINLSKQVQKPETKYYITQGEKILFEEMGYKELFASNEEILSEKEHPEVFRIYYKE